MRYLNKYATIARLHIQLKLNTHTITDLTAVFLMFANTSVLRTRKLGARESPAVYLKSPFLLEEGNLVVCSWFIVL